MTKQMFSATFGHEKRELVFLTPKTLRFLETILERRKDEAVV